MKTLLNSKLLVFTAHPDDESYTCAGTLYKNGKNGGKTILVCATLGENGKIFLKKPVTKTEMKSIRKREIMHSAKLLNLSKVIVIGIPDGKVSEYKNKLLKRGVAITRVYQPDFILSFGSDGFSGHRDHITVGKIARMIAKKNKIPFIAFSLPSEFMKTAKRYLASRRKSSNYKNTKFAKPNLRISVSPIIKKRSLGIYVSQKGVGNNPFAKLKYECFVWE